MSERQADPTRLLTRFQVSNQLYSSLEAQNKAALSFVGDLEVRVGGAADQAVAVLVRRHPELSSNMTPADNGELQTNAHSVANELRETVASMIGVRSTSCTKQALIDILIQELAVAGVSAADLALSLQSGSAAAARIAVSIGRAG